MTEPKENPYLPADYALILDGLKGETIAAGPGFYPGGITWIPFEYNEPPPVWVGPLACWTSNKS